MSGTCLNIWPSQATRRVSRRKQGLSIWLKAFSNSMVERHRFPSLSRFCCHRRMLWTMASQFVFDSELQLRRSEVTCHAFGNCGHQGFCCETSKSVSYGQWLPSFSLKAVSEALAIQETTGPGMLPSAIIRTIVGRERITSSLRLCSLGEQALSRVLRSRARRKGASRTMVCEEAEARETGASGRSFLLAMSSTRGWMAVSHLLGDIFGVGIWLGVRRAGRSRPWKVGPPSPEWSSLRRKSFAPS